MESKTRIQAYLVDRQITEGGYVSYFPYTSLFFEPIANTMAGYLFSCVSASSIIYYFSHHLVPRIKTVLGDYGTGKISLDEGIAHVALACYKEHGAFLPVRLCSKFLREF